MFHLNQNRGSIENIKRKTQQCDITLFHLFIIYVSHFTKSRSNTVLGRQFFVVKEQCYIKQSHVLVLPHFIRRGSSGMGKGKGNPYI